MMNAELLVAFKQALPTPVRPNEGACEVTWASRKFPKGAFKHFQITDKEGQPLIGKVVEFGFQKRPKSQEHIYSAKISWKMLKTSQKLSES